MSHPAIPYTNEPELAACIAARKHIDRDRANERDRLAMRSGVPAARDGDVGGYVAEVTKHLEGRNGR